MYEWKFGPKRVLLLCFCGFLLGVEATLILIGVNEGLPASSLFLKNGLTSIAVVLVGGNFFLSAREKSKAVAQAKV